METEDLIGQIRRVVQDCKHSGTRSGDLARFRHVTDSLAALYRRSHTTDEVEEEDEQ